MNRIPYFEVVFHSSAGGYKRGQALRVDWTTNGMVAYVKGEKDEVAVPIDNFTTFLFEDTGMFDGENRLIFHGDIITNPAGDLFSVIYYFGAFWLQKGDGEGIPLTEELCRTLKVVGDIVRDSRLLIPEEIPQVLKDADKKQNGPKEPPLIRNFKF